MDSDLPNNFFSKSAGDYTKQRGMAILVTLTIVSILIATTLELNRRARADIDNAATRRDRITLNQMVAAGVQGAMAILLEDKQNSEIDSIQEDWANAEKMAQFTDGLQFEDGRLAISISDELSRIQINALVEYPEGRQFDEKQRMLWERFLKMAFLVYESQDLTDPVSTIVNSLKDWQDSGDDDAISGLTGAESEYYQDLEPPYSTRNGPLMHISEMLRIQGISPELYYGSEEIPGLVQFLTVAGMDDDGGGQFTFKGKININTADIPVLMALLPEENRDLALAIDDYRLERSGDSYTHELSGATWYKDVPGAGDITIDADLITTASNLFRVVVAAELHGLKTQVTAIVRREEDTESGKFRCRLLSWKLN